MNTRVWVNIICSVFLLGTGLPGVLSKFGVGFPSVLGFISGIFLILLQGLSAFWLFIEGANSHSVVKFFSYVSAAIIGIYFIAGVLGLLGMGFSLPGFIHSIADWFYVIGGLVLLLSIWSN